VATSPEPVLVYDRIAENRRRARLLVGVFVLILLPFGLGFVPFGIPLVEFGVLLPLLGGQGFDRLVRTTPEALHLGAGTFVLAALVIVGVLVTAQQFRQSTRLVLHLAGARSLRRDQEPVLRQILESLCIGAGLPVPPLYLIDTSAPNAFAAGLDPERAVVVVTRGLLQLLDRRELEAVIAHELSHIGNQDIRLGTLLAAAVATLRLPVAIVFRFGPFFGACLIGVSALFLLLALVAMIGIVVEIALAFWFFWDEMVATLRTTAPGGMMWFAFFFLYGWLFAASPFYVLVGAQLCGLSVGGRISREREFLADADAALLTRDPEGLALALAKLAGASGIPMDVSAATAHLYVVEPLAVRGPWWNRRFASHPLIEQRIAALARIGSGISPTALEAARAVGDAFRLRTGGTPSARLIVVDDPGERDGALEAAPVSSAPVAVTGDVPWGSGVESYVRTKAEQTPLYDRTDGTSASRQLRAGSALSVLQVDGEFLRVRTSDGVMGYIPRSTPVSWEAS
jgi:heat shock protein HtpX